MEIVDFLYVTGMLSSIFGAILEVIGLLSANKNILVRQAGTYFGYNSQLYISQVEQKIRAIFGFICISIGFVFQFLSGISDKGLLNEYYIPSFVVILLYCAFVIIIISTMNYRIRTDINYFLIPNEMENIKRIITKYEEPTISIEKLRNQEEQLRNQIERLARGLKKNFKFKNYDADKETIFNLLLQADEYTKKHRLYDINGNQ